jgi:hypothetical protein
MTSRPRPSSRTRDSDRAETEAVVTEPKTEQCDSCGAEGFRLTLSPDGDAQVCDGCLAALTARTPVLAWVRWALIALGYWIRPYDSHLDARRWRWQESGCAKSRRVWRDAGPELHEAVRRIGGPDA